jgi:hypothetical protein
VTSSEVIRFFDARPFVPFTFILVNGREVPVQHPEQVVVGDYALVVTYIHATRQVEVIDAAHIVSLRTMYAVDLDNL